MKKLNTITGLVFLILGLIATGAALTTAPHQWAMAIPCFAMAAAHATENLVVSRRKKRKA